jgi:hypothetical protein
VRGASHTPAPRLGRGNDKCARAAVSRAPAISPAGCRHCCRRTWCGPCHGDCRRTCRHDVTAAITVTAAIGVTSMSPLLSSKACRHVLSARRGLTRLGWVQRWGLAELADVELPELFGGLVACLRISALGVNSCDDVGIRLEAVDLLALACSPRRRRVPGSRTFRLWPSTRPRRSACRDSG